MFGIVTLLKLQPARNFLLPIQPAFQPPGCDSLRFPLVALSDGVSAPFVHFWGLLKGQ